MSNIDYDSDDESIYSRSMAFNDFDDDDDMHSVVSSQTSYAGAQSMRSASPTPSVMSITDSIRDMIYKHEYGRGLNNYSDVYRLPADDQELDRQVNQHVMLTEIMGGKYVPPMAEVMREEPFGEQKACLDLGCGSGDWSEVDDINLGLEHFYGDFDVVHARLVASGIRDYHHMLQQITHVVRPGGLIDISEFDWRVYDQNRRPHFVDPNDFTAPWLARWMDLVLKAVKQSGGDADAALHLHEWISNNPAFEDVVYREFYFPIIDPRDTSKDTPAQKRLYKRVYDDLLAFFASSKPLILGSGIPQEMFDDLEKNCMQELAEYKIPQYSRYRMVYARKRRLHIALAILLSLDKAMDIDEEYAYDSDNETVDSRSMSIDPFSDSRSVTSSQTSHGDPHSLRSISPAPSVLPLSETVREMILKEEYGRNLNTYSNVYRLPADEEELDRLEKQHSMLAEIMGGKYVPPMQEVMAEEALADQKTCLDLGCGGGSWIIDVARDFPHCSAVAVDLVPMQTHMAGLSQVRDYHHMIQQIAHVVRPGGLIDMSEFDFRTYDENRRVIKVDPVRLGPPWFSCWMYLIRNAIIKNGGDVDAATHLHEWISSNLAFEDVVYREFYTPMIDIPRDRSKDTELQRTISQKLHKDLLVSLTVHSSEDYF
ncbi:hypothetical protein CVT24_008655 [Panaeolus cyanescens]|uniref:Methyltransferase domain-containing protein n=1 Tax=Panaeolus cyanescens TaxID=181874 RepID=A0A409VBB9_9AGAR|nr:hypothetical protein CVT24_008655 [Panaeolus cyanescens]